MRISRDALKNVLCSRARLGEGAMWNHRDQHLYWVDIYNHVVHQFNPATGECIVFDTGAEVTCLASAGEQQLIVALRDRLAFLDTQTGTVTPLISVEAENPHTRLNDGKADPQGRFWVGSISERAKPEANLYRYDPDGSLHQMETGLTNSNGLGWSPDQSTFYLTDTPTHKIYAYQYEPQTGSIRDRRVLIDLSQEGLFPDGLAIDAEGCLWSAMWDAWCVIRFDPNGQEVARVEMPVQCPTCCAFGDADLKTLYITTASVGQSQAEIQKSFYSGDLFALRTDVVGLPANSFNPQ
ncbi:MAG: SMP-30/gluconolactonase/LRE family protein [Oscillatoriales cyanobacterium C42_A2020_001]|nr:SMP-30/gluconolactonase/LRE family protein [Leptolyngbyaceae cyanobacterium C42_A2020_001]